MQTATQIADIDALSTGVAIASVNQIWVNTFPWLSSGLSSLRPYAPAIHSVATYAWLLFSVIFPGGFLHGIAAGYLISIQKDKKKTREG